MSALTTRRNAGGAGASAGNRTGSNLSRDSRHGQRIGDALAVEIDDGVMDGLVERSDVCEGLVGEVMGLKIAPDRLDVVEFGCVFRQPLDGEPVCAGGQGGERAFAGVDRTIVLDFSLVNKRFAHVSRSGFHSLSAAQQAFL